MKTKVRGITMKILKESKENLPIAFLTDFISKGWEEVGYLKADIEAIKEAYKGTKPIEILIQDLIDAYLVCIGQLEAHLHDKNYLDYPEESGLSGEKLEEDLEIRVSADKVEIKTEKTTPVEVNEEEDLITIGVDEAEVKFDDSKLAMSDEDVARVNEPFEYFVDFEEPDMSQPKLTDKDLYDQE
jgi:hypothetical protein